MPVLTHGGSGSGRDLALHIQAMVAGAGRPYHRDLIDTVENLARGVKAGRRVDVRAGYSKYPVGQHFVFFRLSEKALDVIRVLHQRTDVERHL